MAYLPIVLGVQRNAWLQSSDTAAGGADPQLRAEIMGRDDHTCQFCGFESRKYQEIHHKDGDLRDNRSDNLVTACTFCHQCFDLERVGKMRGGILIWLPEIGQAALHHIARAVYIARIARGPMAEAARVVLDALMSRRNEVKQRLGTDDPLVLGAILQDFVEECHSSQSAQKLDGIRLLPLDRRIIREGEMEFNQFPQILAYWRSKEGPFSGVMPATWPDLFDSVASTAGQIDA